MSKKFIGTLLGTFIIVGGAFFWVLYQGSGLPKPVDPVASVGESNAPAAPLLPSVGLSVITSSSGNTFRIEWHNLPDGTVALNILRRAKDKPNAPWTLWKQVTVPANELAGGFASFGIGSSLFSEYSFSIQAVGNLTGQGENGTTTIGQTITWISSSTTPTVVTSTPPTPPPASPPSDQPPTPTSSPTSTPPAPTPSSTPTSTPSTPTGTPAGPQGIPYYNPQVQLSGYGYPPTGSFWVQHTNQKIEIGWQNLPVEATIAEIYRASEADGPWIRILTQSGIDTVGPYTIQLVDNTLGAPYYYQMNAKNGAATIATYGPVLLPPASN